MAKKTAAVPPKSENRLQILEKIAEYEKNRWFDRDVEDDPPTRPLDYSRVDFVGRKFSTRLQTRIANCVARAYYDRRIRRRQLILEPPVDPERYDAVPGGAVLTCNHFSVNDNYAVYKTLQKRLGRRDLYKVIREGNFTSFPGIYGYFFRHCNTLPLSASAHGMRVFLQSANELLTRGEKILIYPEQGMWWNYRKPRPCKPGAYYMAAKAGVPVIPIFIGMADSDVIDPDGFPVQAYTLHFLSPITPDPTLPLREDAARMAEINYTLWRECYESFYGIPLSYGE